MVALIGANGSGKTTIAKLLCRLYDPTDGRVTLDDIDVREFSKVEYRSEVAAIFQDFVRYQMTARDNIAFGNVGERHTAPGVEQAALRAEELGCRRTMLLGLAVSRPLHDGSLPSAIEAELRREPQIATLADRIWGWLSSETPVSLSFRERAGIDLTLIDSGTGRLSYAIRRILTPTQKDWAATRLPRRLAFLYVPLRFARLAGQYGPAPWRLRRLLRADLPRSESGQNP